MISDDIYMLSDDIHDIRWYTWYPMIYMISDDIHDIQWYTWYPMIYMLSDDIHDIRWYAWYPMICMISDDIHNIRWYTWYPMIYMLSDDIHDIRWYAWYPMICMISDDIHNIRWLSWYPMIYMLSDMIYMISDDMYAIRWYTWYPMICMISDDIHDIRWYTWYPMICMISLARVITNTSKYQHITPTLKKLHWLPIRQRINYKICLLTYKTLTNKQPTYLYNSLSFPSHSVSTRSSDSLVLSIPYVRSSLGKRAFSVIGPRLWNSLPPDTRNSSSLPIFRSRLKTHLFKIAFPSLGSFPSPLTVYPDFDSCYSHFMPYRMTPSVRHRAIKVHYYYYYYYIRWYAWYPMIYMISDDMHDIRWYTWYPMICMISDDIHDIRWYAWYPMIYMISDDIPAIRFYTNMLSDAIL